MKRIIRDPRLLGPAVLGFLTRNPSYSAIVLGITALTVFYYGLINSDRYMSEARIIVERESSSSVPQVAMGLLALGGGSTALDAQLIKRFIESPAMLDHLQDTLQLREHFSQDSIDWISRLPSDASREKFLKYFLSRVEVEIDEQSLTIDLAVQGYDREYAQRLATAIVQRSEQFVNEISHTLAREQIAFAQKELDGTYARLQKTSAAVVEMQNKEGVFSPEIENQSISQIISGLQQELAKQRTELKALSAYLSDSAPEVKATQKQIAALERQIAQERAKQVGGTRDEKLNEKLLKFQEVKLSEQIAIDIYQTGLKTLEAARLDAARKVKYLMLVSAPTLPDDSVRPRRIYIIVTTFLVLNILYAIGGLVIATIKDHRE